MMTRIPHPHTTIQKKKIYIYIFFQKWAWVGVDAHYIMYLHTHGPTCVQYPPARYRAGMEHARAPSPLPMPPAWRMEDPRWSDTAIAPAQLFL